MPFAKVKLNSTFFLLFMVRDKLNKIFHFLTAPFKETYEIFLCKSVSQTFK